MEYGLKKVLQLKSHGNLMASSMKGRCVSSTTRSWTPTLRPCLQNIRRRGPGGATLRKRGAGVAALKTERDLLTLADGHRQ